MESTTALVIAAGIGFSGNILAVILTAILTARNAVQLQKDTARNAQRAQEDALKAQIATSKAAESLEVAKRIATDGARALLAEAKESNKIAKDTNHVSHSTHHIINGQNTKLLYAILLLAERVAQEHPDDKIAQAAADAAKADYDDALIRKSP